MKPRSMWIGALVALFASASWAQDISGKWQGTIEQGLGRARLILTIEKAATSNEADVLPELSAFLGSPK